MTVSGVGGRYAGPTLCFIALLAFHARAFAGDGTMASLAALQRVADETAPEPGSDAPDDAERPTLKPGDLAALPLEQLLDVHVTTASRFDQPLADAPSTVYVLSGKDFARFGWRTLADALRTLPGLYVGYDRNYAYLGARGILRPGNYDTRFLLLIDGYRTNDAVYGEAAIGSEFLLDIDTIARIEYMPGAGSSVYGSNAFLGVINVITKSGRDASGARATVETGSFGEKRASATYGWKGDQGAQLFVAASALDSPGQNLHFPEFDTPDQNDGVADGLDFDHAQKFFGKFSYEDFTVSLAHSNRTKGIPTASFAQVFSDPRSQTTDAQSYATLGFDHWITGATKIGGHVFWGRYDYSGSYVYDYPPVVVNRDGSYAEWYGVDTQIVTQAIAGHKMVIGADFTRDAHRDQWNYDIEPFVPYLNDHRTGNRTGLYGEDEFSITPRWLLNVGLRYDFVTPSGGALSPRTTLIWKATDAATAKLSFGSAFRAPNAYELYYQEAGPGGQEANPRLKSEKIHTLQFALEQRLSNDARATVTVFRSNIDNLITQTVDPASQLLVFQNLDRVESRGVELAYEQAFASGATLRASYSWQLARDRDTGLTLQDSPRHLVKLNWFQPLIHDAVRVGTEALCTSSRKASGGSVGGFCIANLTVALPRVAPHTALSGSAYNIFNKRYADPAGPEFVQNALQQDGRAFLLRLTVQY